MKKLFGSFLFLGAMATARADMTLLQMDVNHYKIVLNALLSKLQMNDGIHSVTIKGPDVHVQYERDGKCFILTAQSIMIADGSEIPNYKIDFPRIMPLPVDCN